MRISMMVALCTSLAAPALAADAWTPFKDPKGAFMVEFPGAPAANHTAQAASNGATVEQTGYSMSSGNSTLMVLDSDFSRFKVDPVAAVENAASAAKNTAASTEMEATNHLDGQNGRALVVIDKNGNRMTDRIFFVGGHLYQVVALAPASLPQQDSDRFVNSFHFASH
jgi:hypothetical protein